MEPNKSIKGLETAFLLVSAPAGTEKDLITDLRTQPEVEEALITLGGWNVFVKIRVKGRKEISDFVIRNLKGKVLETRTLFARGDGGPP